MKSVVGMSNISAMMSTISVRSPHQHQHQPPPCRRHRGTGTFGIISRHYPLCMVQTLQHYTWVQQLMDTRLFQHLQKPRAGEWRDVVKNCASA